MRSRRVQPRWNPGEIASRAIDAPITRNQATVCGSTSSNTETAIAAPMYCESAESTNSASGGAVFRTFVRDPSHDRRVVGSDGSDTPAILVRDTCGWCHAVRVSLDRDEIRDDNRDDNRDADHVFHRAPDRAVAIRAEGSTITTADGRTFLDGAGGAIACSIGHGRPEVVAAMAQQAATVDYVHATQFESGPLRSFASKLASLVPVDDARVFPVSGGSEANETAFKLARTTTSRAATATGTWCWRAPAPTTATVGAPSMRPTGRRCAPDTSRGSVTRCGSRWPTRIATIAPVPTMPPNSRRSIRRDRDRPGRGVHRRTGRRRHARRGGPARRLLAGGRRVCRRHGVLVILDEVMTGFGRTGEWFAADHWGVRPDILTAGKGASSGYWPLGLWSAPEPSTTP